MDSEWIPELYFLLPPDKQAEYKKLTKERVTMHTINSWSNDEADPLKDLIDWAESVDYDPLKDSSLSIIEIEEIIKRFLK